MLTHLNQIAMFCPCPPNCSKKISCCYINHSDKVQIGRISNVADWYLERVIFPGQRLLFEAPAEAELEIYTNSFSSAILSERIRCEHLEFLKLN